MEERRVGLLGSVPSNGKVMESVRSGWGSEQQRGRGQLCFQGKEGACVCVYLSCEFVHMCMCVHLYMRVHVHAHALVHTCECMCALARVRRW